ncbi:hypothetical protein CDL12_17482 [Handroanthus impetiginosus]|uniref:Uncharacterized protein n=1 Tax=Handroanthus impetiginosus TaxID=429701 RepID=A0A2G9GXF3_9LAMI|nr:hypothetical protein CDL12_17482 [Handroanthus impetiginosus]
MHVSMYKWTQILVILNFSILITQTSVSFSTKVDDHVPDPSIKCGECPCTTPCSPQLPSPTQLSELPPPLQPPTEYLSPPPPRFVYVTSVASPPPPRFEYVTGSPGNLYPSDPFSLDIYSTASQNSLETRKLLVVVVFSALQLLL